MSFVVALISDSSLLDTVIRQTRTLAVDCSYVFDASDFRDMLPKRSCSAVIAETAALGCAPRTFVERVRRAQPAAHVVLLGTTASDFSAQSCRVSILRLPLAEGDLARSLVRPPELSLETDALSRLVGASAALEALREKVRLFAGVESTVLILGESGTGKEKLARAIHELSPRRDGPFVAIHCGALSPEIVESELFGHVRGAFTGADRDRQGHFELANHGTLFLDEIATMRAEHQVKLLRVLQDRRFLPVGSSQPVPVDVRVLAATNADLRASSEAGHFREDLFYRLAVLELSVPPLRDRLEDLPDLAAHFVREYARRNGTPCKTISSAAMDRLRAHPWKGNVRELENAVEHAMVLSTGRDRIETFDLPGGTGDPRRVQERVIPRLTPEGVDLNATVSRMEREMILQSLALADGNKSRAAELLGLKRTTFVEKMRRLDLVEFETELSA